MAHQIPKELKGEERIFSIPLVNLHYNKKGTIYACIAIGISVVVKKITNTWVFIPTVIILNMIAYPLAHLRIPKNRFEGGNLSLDVYFLRRLKYKHLKKNLYIRRRKDI